MKKIFLIITATFLYYSPFAQVSYYAAAKAGLSIREQAGTTAKILDKVPYGEKITIIPNSEQQVAIATEGFNGFWWKIKYKDKTGYVVSSYVLPVPPPRAGIKTLQDYFAQASSPFGGQLVVKHTDETLAEMGESTITKQLYKNGMEWTKTDGYENSSYLYMIPGLTLEQCFLLVRLIGQYPGLIGEKDPFPSKKSVTKVDNGERTVEVEKENYDGRPGPINKLKIGLAQGAVTEFEIYLLDTQAVIFWTSGV
ncbi:MAG TPA: SH3 domain-containing protein [Ferruginibacter sp.]|nr:SH3 domain-containing protein [Ferruginibacter sp.]